MTAARRHTGGKHDGVERFANAVDRGQFGIDCLTVELLEPLLPGGGSTRPQPSGDLLAQCTAAFDQTTGVGTYVAMESFEGSLHGRNGAFNFAHPATTSGSDRTAEFFVIAPSRGTGEPAGIAGAGGMTVDADGTHRIWFDYEIG